MEEEEQGETIGFATLKNPLTRLFLLGLVITLLLSSVFVLGGWYSCNAGGGTLSQLKCTNIEVVAACEDITGKRYRIPQGYNITTVDLMEK